MITAEQRAGRRLVIAAGGTASGLVLLLSYPTSLPSGPASAVSTELPAAVTPVDTATGTNSRSTGTTTVTGRMAQTRWGPVQVRLTLSAGKVVVAEAIVYPSGNRRDAEINGYAVPILNSEVVTAQSAQIDTVSGATVTSDGYLQSLQSAVDAAHLS